MFATKNGNLKLLSFLCENNFKILKPCLPMACKINNYEIMECLIKYESPKSKKCYNYAYGRRDKKLFEFLSKNKVSCSYKIF